MANQVAEQGEGEEQDTNGAVGDLAAGENNDDNIGPVDISAIESEGLSDLPVSEEVVAPVEVALFPLVDVFNHRHANDPDDPDYDPHLDDVFPHIYGNKQRRRKWAQFVWKLLRVNWSV